MSESYELGQIIYILSDKAQTIVPAIVAEEFVHKKLLDGKPRDVITYKVYIGPSTPTAKPKMVDLDKIAGEVFVNLEDIKNTLLNRLTVFVNNLIAESDERAKTWYGNQKSATSVVESKDSSSEKIDPQVFLDNAMKSTPVLENQKTQPKNIQQMSVQEKIRQMASPTLEEEFESADGESIKVKLPSLPDGREVKARIHLKQ